MRSDKDTQNRVVINTNKRKGNISRHIYGHFSEHLGRCIYGGIWVGEDSSIPNVRGIRTDVVEALRAIRIPNLRWPGGCFADEYHWQDGIGPRETRPCMVNTHWGGVTENNHFGTHEFMDLCAQLDCEPYICGNVGSGAVREMQQWVEYLTFDGISPMASQRAANGQKAPWKVKYWGVGNENWGCGGNMRPEYYADLYRRHATYLRNFGENRIFKIAGGANVDDYNWTEVLMREAGRFMDGLSLHYYAIPGSWEEKQSATEFDEEGWFEGLKKALFIGELIDKHSGIMDRYDPEKRVHLVVDEWGTWFQVEPETNPGFLYQQNTMRDALVAALTLNIFNAHCDRVKMANIAQTVNVLQAMILTHEEQMILTPTYHVFDMYKVHQDAELLAVDLVCQEYVSGMESIPALNATASMDENDRTHVSLCNTFPDASLDVRLEMDLSNSTVTTRILTADSITAHNTFENPDEVCPCSFDDFAIENDAIHITLPPASVVVLKAE